MDPWTVRATAQLAPKMSPIGEGAGVTRPALPRCSGSRVLGFRV